MDILINLSKNKFEDIKKVCPNFVQNRYDILYGKNFELFEIKYNEQVYYVPFHIEFITCKLGLWLVEIQKEAVEEIIKFIFNKYKFVFQIKIISSVNEYKNAYKTTDYWINLPDNEDEYIMKLTGKQRYNIKNHIKRLKEDFGEYTVKKYEKDQIPPEIIKKYFKLKKQTRGKSYFITPKSYLKKYAVTCVYALYIKGTAEAMAIVSENNNNLYLENVTYNPEYSKYSIGVTICFEMILDAIRNRKNQIFFGSSEKDDYKSRMCNASKETFSFKAKRKDYLKK